MGIITDQLVSFRYVTKLHGLMLGEISRKFGLTDMEMNIIAFLHNNPRLDTAADIVELRRLSKSNVSKAVSSLCSKKLLTSRTYESDRRKVHLILTAEAFAIEKEIAACTEKLLGVVFDGFSKEDAGLYKALNARIKDNIVRYLEENDGKR